MHLCRYYTDELNWVAPAVLEITAVFRFDQGNEYIKTQSTWWKQKLMAAFFLPVNVMPEDLLHRPGR